MMQILHFFNVLLLVTAHQPFMKFGMLEKPPMFMRKNSTVAGDNLYDGIWIDMIEWLSQHLNFKYEIIFVNNVLGRPQTLNGSGVWSGASGRLLRGDFDVLGPPVLMSFARNRVFHSVGVVEDEPSALLTPALTEMSSILSSIKPFQPMVWLLILISLLSAAICFAASSPSNEDRPFWYKRLIFSRIGNYVFYTVAILTNQGPVFALRKFQSKLPFRLTAGVWCLFACVMVNVYSSTLTSHITARKMSTPPTGGIQVMEEGVLSYLVIDDSFGREIILGATTGKLKKLGDLFRRHPENFVPDQETGFRKVATGCCAFSDFVSYFNYRIGKDFQETGKCRVHIGKPVKGYGFTGLLIRKDNNYRDAINQGILDLYQTGLVDYWRKKQAGRGYPVCQAQSKKKSKVLRSLNLRQDLVTAFFILGIGISTSFIVFLAEQCRRCKCR
ncbi:hypothetical protein GHT06_018895 [Daphnia sinensis]|uniref:Ionotropic glutamate receptor L-glutamate and glycine-binding domain-containing protein n=1 Tax=Daphnia sinensis TaxID=1820382 RepID=A0AAD5PQP8_9CRUS|nr:hypothetical protein GHT06_018895 [Daphnia sinensis]